VHVVLRIVSVLTCVPAEWQYLLLWWLASLLIGVRQAMLKLASQSWQGFSSHNHILVSRAAVLLGCCAAVLLGCCAAWLLGCLPAGAVSVTLVYYYFDDNPRYASSVADLARGQSHMPRLLCCCAAWLQVL
jgi:ABC-type nitrate/sulfonate/bicarbonate transport system permease component